MDLSMPNQVTVPWSSRSLFWGYFCGGAAIIRAASYLIIPPEPNALSSKTFEEIFLYHEWALILLVVGGVINFATAFQAARVGFVAHLLAFFCYTVFTFSLLSGIMEVVDGKIILIAGWAGIYPTFGVALINGERCLTLGAIVRIESAARRVDRLSSRDDN
jgi:hypothetical protein